MQHPKPGLRPHRERSRGTATREALKHAIEAWWRRREDGEVLLRALNRLMRRHIVRRRLPPEYLPGRRRDDRAFLDLAHDLFVECHCARIRWEPFRGRVPFMAFVEDDMTDPQIQMYLDVGRYSLARTVLARQYNHNCDMHTDLGRRRRTWREVGDVLVELERAGAVGAAVPGWRAGFRAKRSVRDEVEALRAAGITDTEQLVRALREACGPLNRAELATAVQEIRGEHRMDLVLPVFEEVRRGDGADAGWVSLRGSEAGAEAPRTAGRADGEGVDTGALHRACELRRGMMAAWDRLSPANQELMLAIGDGLRYREIQSRYPGRFNNGESVRYQLEKALSGFVAACEAAVASVDGREDTSLPDLCRNILVFLDMNQRREGILHLKRSMP